MAKFSDSHYFECDCYSDEHVFKFTLDKDDADFYLHVFLNDFDRWYKCKYGHWDVTMLDKEDVERLRDLCDKALWAKHNLK
jgi:hypothetical protein